MKMYASRRRLKLAAAIFEGALKKENIITMSQSVSHQSLISRRQVFTAIGGAGTVALAPALAMAQSARSKMWRPKLGLLAKFSQSNLDFTKKEGFRSIGLWANPGTSLDADKVTDAKIASVKSAIQASGLYLSNLGATVNHTDADPARRKRAIRYFVKVLKLTAALGTPYIGTQTGFTVGQPFDKQIDEVVRVYEENYFPLCEKYNLKILWEPWPGGRTHPVNLATGPVGFAALFKAFRDSPYVGLQYDPSHLVWQMMDPIQAARDFIDKIYNVHLKDTEIEWSILKRTGINPPNHVGWWRYRLPGWGSIDWPAFFTVLMKAGYSGAMNIEHEDRFYGPPYVGNEFTDAYREGFRMAHRYLHRFVPE